ncbi:hypothetical protein ACLOJK_031993 [Asimina triloba]
MAHGLLWSASWILMVGFGRTAGSCSGLGEAVGCVEWAVFHLDGRWDGRLGRKADGGKWVGRTAVMGVMMGRDSCWCVVNAGAWLLDRGSWLDAGGRLLLVGIKSVMEMGHAGSMMEKLDDGGAVGARGVIVVLLRGVDGRTDLLSGGAWKGGCRRGQRDGFNPSRLGVMGYCPLIWAADGCWWRQKGRDGTMMRSSSACLPRHFGWLGSSVRITAGKLAAAAGLGEGDGAPYGCSGGAQKIMYLQLG